MKKQPFQPNHFYLIRNTANNREKIFFEERNYYYFLNLLHRHLRHIGTLHACSLQEDRFDLVIHINDEAAITEKYREKIHLPLSHFFNAYCKGVNKAYGRSGSLFREHFSGKISRPMKSIKSSVNFNLSEIQKAFEFFQ